jgi:hypothetical protein
MKFTKPYLGVKSGDVYPTAFEVGDECPPELLEGAISRGVVSIEKAAKPAQNKALNAAPQNK